MRDPADPDRMAPEERVREIAAILAAGYLRLRDARASGPSEPLGNVLDVSRRNERPCAELVDAEETS